MKKISLLVLVCLVFLLCLTSCSIFMAKEQPDDAHEHTFSTEWSTSATEHWHAATCEHADEKSDVASHSDAGEDGVCDVCNYVLFTLHTVTVTADKNVNAKVDANGHLTSYMADVDTDAAYTADTEVIKDGYFHESEYRSAPYFDIQIDGITLLNAEF